MCYPILIAKLACKYGHIRDAIPCWRQCPQQTALSQQTGEWNLCPNSESLLNGSDLPWNKYYTKTHAVRPNVGACYVCKCLEDHGVWAWKVAREELEECERLLRPLEVEEKKLKDERSEGRANNFRFHGTSEEQLDEKIADVEDKVVQARMELERKQITFRAANEYAPNQRIIDEASRWFRTWAGEGFSINDRRFFVGRVKPGDEHITAFPEGRFNYSVIKVVE